MGTVKHPDEAVEAANQGTMFGLLRHGETVWNSQKRIQGFCNSPLTKAGKEQAQRWAEQLVAGNWQHILVSPLGRAQETAGIINEVLQLQMTTDDRLKEQNWGDWEGAKLNDLKRENSVELNRQIKAGWQFCPPGGESRGDVSLRALCALTDIQQRISHKKILVICHMGVIKCLLYRIAERKFLPEEPSLIKNNHMHIISAHRDKFQITELNIGRQGDGNPVKS